MFGANSHLTTTVEDVWGDQFYDLNIGLNTKNGPIFLKKPCGAKARGEDSSDRLEFYLRDKMDSVSVSIDVKVAYTGKTLDVLDVLIDGKSVLNELY
ncbi:hypothetical protein K9L97_04830 [Candidatus Woesearchaeota archaeon]|nr:hypothetical protein [Candidatus Woesearchaeota archaeon]